MGEVNRYKSEEDQINKELITRVEEAISIMKHCEVMSGICMCGDSMDGHGDCFYSGHTAIDSGEYYASLFLEKAQLLVNKITKRDDPMHFGSRLFDTNKSVIWSNPDLRYDEGEL